MQRNRCISVETAAADGQPQPLEPLVGVSFTRPNDESQNQSQEVSALSDLPRLIDEVHPRDALIVASLHRSSNHTQSSQTDPLVKTY